MISVIQTKNKQINFKRIVSHKHQIIIELIFFPQTYADYTPKKRAAVLKRVRKKYKLKKSDKDDSDIGDSDKDVSDNADPPTFGIALEDYIQIFSVLIHIDDVDKV
jgi:hypothetical protein